MGLKHRLLHGVFPDLDFRGPVVPTPTHALNSEALQRADDRLTEGRGGLRNEVVGQGSTGSFRTVSEMFTRSRRSSPTRAVQTICRRIKPVVLGSAKSHVLPSPTPLSIQLAAR